MGQTGLIGFYAAMIAWSVLLTLVGLWFAWENSVRVWEQLYPPIMDPSSPKSTSSSGVSTRPVGKAKQQSGLFFILISSAMFVICVIVHIPYFIAVLMGLQNGKTLEQRRQMSGVSETTIITNAALFCGYVGTVYVYLCRHQSAFRTTKFKLSDRIENAVRWVILSCFLFALIGTCLLVSGLPLLSLIFLLPGSLLYPLISAGLIGAFMKATHSVASEIISHADTEDVRGQQLLEVSLRLSIVACVGLFSSMVIAISVSVQIAAGESRILVLMNAVLIPLDPVLNLFCMACLFKVNSSRYYRAVFGRLHQIVLDQILHRQLK